MGGRLDQHSKLTDIATVPAPDAGALRNLALWTIGILLLALWRAYDGFRHPESRTNDFLHALLVLLFGALAWGRRLTRGTLVIKPSWGWGGDLVNHWTAGLAPLLVVLAFVWAQVEDSRHQAARNELTLKKQAWQQNVDRQRQLSQEASHRLQAASAKQADAFRSSIDTSQKLTMPDGRPGFRINPDAARKLKEAEDEYNQALARDRDERARLIQLETDFWRNR